MTDWPSNLVTEGISYRVIRQVIEQIRLFVISLENYMIIYSIDTTYSVIIIKFMWEIYILRDFRLRRGVNETSALLEC